MSEFVKVLSPYDLSEVGQVERLSEENVMTALAESYEVYNDRSRWLKPAKRIEILERVVELVKNQREFLAKQAASEGGKPLVDSLVEVDRGIQGIKIAIEEISQLKGQEIPMNLNASSMGRMAFTFREPRGVVLAVSAFNHPFNLIVHQVVPAIASGCPVLVKPASGTPLSCQSLVEIFHEAGLPLVWCRMILCQNSIIEKVLSDKRVGFFSFIGSSQVGWMLRSKLSRGATCAMEHGGSAPVIFEPDASLEEALPLLVKGGFYHAGQVCVSVQRLFVHETLIEKFQGEFVKKVKALVTGNPLSLSTEVGPMITPKELDRVDDWVQEAISGGGKLLCGGKKISETCYAPTVILDPPKGCQLDTKEVFGPVVSLYTYKTKEEAIKRANALDFSFQGAVFTKNLDTALQVVKGLNAMAVMVNDHTAFRVDWMPFGGHKDSGVGIGGIGQTMEEMTIEKLMVIRSEVL